MLQKDFNSMPLLSNIIISVQRRNSTIRSRKEIIILQLLLKMMTDGENARQCAKSTQRPETGRIQGQQTSFDANQEIGPVLNFEIVAVIDVLGIEVQAPSLRTPGYSVWILISRGHERMVDEIRRHNSDTVNDCASLRTKGENLNNVCFESSKLDVVNHVQGSQDSNNVKAKLESSSVLRETVASTMREAPASSKSSNVGSGGSSNPTSIHAGTQSI